MAEANTLQTFRVSSSNGPRDIKYQLKVSPLPNAPLLVILHGHVFSAEPAKFSDDKYNILCPMDRFGVKQAGSWYLGEKGDFFWLNAMEKLLDHVRAVTGYRELFFWGSSMGGYGAILHGVLNKAKAIYANIPQVYLINSKYSNSGMSVYFQSLFAEGELPVYNDLTNLISESAYAPDMYLCYSRWDKNDYLEDQGMRLVRALTAARKTFYLEVRPTDGHVRAHTIAEALALMRRYGAAPS